MQTYRCYPLTLAGKVRSPAREISAETDGEALRLACDMRDNQPLEVWRDTHLVARLSPWPTSPAPDYLLTSDRENSASAARSAALGRKSA